MDPAEGLPSARVPVVLLTPSITSIRRLFWQPSPRLLEPSMVKDKLEDTRASLGEAINSVEYERFLLQCWKTLGVDLLVVTI